MAVYRHANFNGLRRSLQLISRSVLNVVLLMRLLKFVIVYFKLKWPITFLWFKSNASFPRFDRELRGALKEKEAAFKQLMRNRNNTVAAQFREARRNSKYLVSSKYGENLVGLTHDFKTNPKRSSRSSSV